MERLETIKLHVFALAMMIFLVLGMSIGCEEEKKKDDLNDTQGGTSASVGLAGGLHDECVDGDDTDLDNTADRYGVPANCSIGMPVASFNNTSLAKFFAVGSYGRSAVAFDTYTISVQVSGGSGIAQISWTSTLTDNSQVNATVLLGVPILVGRYGLVLYFTEDDMNQFFLSAGDFWTVNAIPESNCLFPPDPGCYPPDSIKEIEICRNGEDDDFDWFTDASDPECYFNCTSWSQANRYYPFWISEYIPYSPECNDGIDNDLDGFIDILDADCQYGATILVADTSTGSTVWVPTPIMLPDDCWISEGNK